MPSHDAYVQNIYLDELFIDFSVDTSHIILKGGFKQRPQWNMFLQNAVNTLHATIVSPSIDNFPNLHNFLN